MAKPNAVPGLPRLWNTRRILICSVLVAVGIAQTLGAIALSASSAALLSGERFAYGVPVYVAIAVSALAALGLFVVQSRYSEQFALSFVHDVRLAYARHTLLLPFDGKSPGVGLSLTRLVNDLGAIKLWLSKGLLSLVTLVPTLATVSAWIALTEPAFLLPLIGSLILWGSCVFMIVAPLRISIRRARQKRGAIALLLGRALPERLPLLMHGKLHPLLRKLTQRSSEVCQYLTTRATWSGMLKAVSRATFPCAVCLYAFTAGAGELPIALFLLIFAFVAAQLEAGAAGLEYFEANKVAREKLAAVFELPAMSPVAHQTSDRLSWKKAVVLEGLQLPSGRVVSQTVPAGECSLITSEDPRDLQQIALTLCGLANNSMLQQVRLDTVSFVDIGRKDLWRNVALVSPVNGIPHYQRGKPAAKLGAKRTIQEECVAEFERAFGLRPNWVPELACSLSETERLKVRIARAFLRNPRMLVVHDDILINQTPLRTMVQTLAHDRQITLVLLSDRQFG